MRSWSIKSLLPATAILTPAETACNQQWLQPHCRTTAGTPSNTSPNIKHRGKNKFSSLIFKNLHTILQEDCSINYFLFYIIFFLFMRHHWNHVLGKKSQKKNYWRLAILKNTNCTLNIFRYVGYFGIYTSPWLKNSEPMNMQAFISQAEPLQALKVHHKSHSRRTWRNFPLLAAGCTKSRLVWNSAAHYSAQWSSNIQN